MRVLILQHAAFEHAGRFRALFGEAGIVPRVVMAPDLVKSPVSQDEFDALWVLGGVMQVWEHDLYPWLANEIDLIRTAVMEHGKPYMGICLGHQLLAAATGGEVRMAKVDEFGLTGISSEATTGSWLLEGLPRTFLAFSWHAAEVSTPAPGFWVAANSALCDIQHVVGENAVASVQFHAEVDSNTMRDWFNSPDVPDALIQKLGPSGDEKLLEALDAADIDLAHLARTVFDNWLARARTQLANG